MNYDELTIKQTHDALASRQLPKDLSQRRSFRAGEHWQSGDGYVGEKPLDNPAVMQAIEIGFMPDNIIVEVLDTHIDGILGREPSEFDYLNRAVVSDETRDAETQKILDAVTSWWDTHKPYMALREALSDALLGEHSVLRVFVPPGTFKQAQDGESVYTAADIAEALRDIYIRVEKPESAGVIFDAETATHLGIFLFKRDNADVAEVSYLDNTGATVWRTIAGDDKKQGSIIAKLLDFITQNNNDAPASVFPSLQLGGRLPIYEMTREPFITSIICQNQRALNLANTMMMRNINMAGSKERVFLNTEAPYVIEDVPDSSMPGGVRKVRKRVPYQTGSGVTNFMTGTEIKDERGKITGYADPNVQYTDPVPIDTFVGTRDHWYATILGQCKQRHTLISGDATASGRSREQARKEFESSLKRSKAVIDDAGRWMLETVLYLAAEMSGQAGKYLNLRAEFSAVVDTGNPSPEERAANLADVLAGLLSKETAMSRNGVIDTGAELERIAATATVLPVNQPPETNP